MVDFGASDAPVKPVDLKGKGLMQFPAIIGGVVPVVNVKGVEGGQLKLTGELLSRIFLGKINKWNGPEIAELNPGRKLPDADIKIIHRSNGSGTTAIFTSYLSEVSKDWKEITGAGKSVNWPISVYGTVKVAM